MFELTQAQRDRIRAWSTEQDRKTVEVQKAALEAELQKPDLTEDQRMDLETSLTLLPNYGAIGGALTYSFTPTTLGIVVKVSHGLTKEELDVSDYEDW